MDVDRVNEFLLNHGAIKLGDTDGKIAHSIQKLVCHGIDLKGVWWYKKAFSDDGSYTGYHFKWNYLTIDIIHDVSGPLLFNQLNYRFADAGYEIISMEEAEERFSEYIDEQPISLATLYGF